MENQSLETVKNQIISDQSNQIKKGRGRPAKSQTSQPLPQTSQINQSSQQFNSQPQTSFRPAIKTAFKITDNLLVKTYKDEKLRSDENEVETIATQGDQVMIEFFPNLKSKWVNLFVFILGVYGMFADKFSIIASKKPPKEAKPKKEDHQEIPLTVETSASYPINPNKRF